MMSDDELLADPAARALAIQSCRDELAGNGGGETVCLWVSGEAQ